MVKYWVYYSLGVRKKNNRPKKIPQGGPFGFYRISKGPPSVLFWDGYFFFGRLNCNIPKIFGFSILLQSFQMVITDEEILMKLMVRNLSKLGLEDRAEKEVKIHSRKI